MSAALAAWLWLRAVILHEFEAEPSLRPLRAWLAKPCAFDTGDQLLPDPCYLMLTPTERLIVRTPRLPKAKHGGA